MKRLICLITCVLGGLCMISCAAKGGDTASDSEKAHEEEKRLLTVEEIMETSSKSSLKCDEYNLTKYMKEVWNSQIIYNETAMFFRDENGSISDKTMIYPIAKVLEVRNNTLETLYEEGKDYTVENGKLHITEGSAIPVMKFEDYLTETPNNPSAVFASAAYEGRYYYYTEGQEMTSKQVSVTYIRTDEWTGPEIPSNSNKLPKTHKKLQNKENLNIVFYGDSVMVGCNSSGFSKVEPNMPVMSRLVTRRLFSLYGYNGDTTINEINTAVGGWTTNNGVENSNFTPRVLDKNPDLVVIHFGCNDATWKLSPQTYGSNLRTMMRRVLAQNPDAEFILISSPGANPDAVGSMGSMAGDYMDYIPVLEGLSEEDNCAFVNMSEMSKFVLSRKEWVDITSNNINHPNDFLIRIEAQLIVSALL